MQYIKLGNSKLRVSRICMGCMGFGDAGKGQHTWTLDEAHTREIIKRGLELGVNFFDTAAAYQGGTSEQYVGRILRELAGGCHQIPAAHAGGSRERHYRTAAYYAYDG